MKLTDKQLREKYPHLWGDEPKSKRIFYSIHTPPSVNPYTIEDFVDLDQPLLHPEIERVQGNSECSVLFEGPFLNDLENPSTPSTRYQKSIQDVDDLIYRALESTNPETILIHEDRQAEVWCCIRTEGAGRARVELALGHRDRIKFWYTKSFIGVANQLEDCEDILTTWEIDQREDKENDL